MPGGHASHKGTSNKPNTNANGVIDDATQTTNPEDLLPENLTNAETLRTDERVDNPAAYQRPQEEPEAGSK